MLKKVVKIYNNGGLAELSSRIFGFLKWELWNKYTIIIMPNFRILNKKVVYNGVRTRPYRSIDRILPINLPANQGGHKNPSNYEYELCKKLRENLQKNDTVVVIGGGLGVTTVIAAQQVGPNGKVIVYEGAANMIEHIKHTLNINDFECEVDVRHAIVSSAKRLAGYSGNARIVSPQNIPDCDVLEMDCEGAELEILYNMEINPKKIIVETHNNKKQVKEALSECEHSIISENIAEIGEHKMVCEENGIYVLYSENKHYS